MCDAGDTGDSGLISGLGRSSGGGKEQPTLVFLPEKSHRQRSLVGYSPKDHKKIRHSKHAHTWNKKSLCFPSGSDNKESNFSAAELGLIPGSERSPGDRNGYPLQYPYLENSMHRGYSAWCGKELDLTERLTFILTETGISFLRQRLKISMIFLW